MRNPFWDGRGPLFGDNRMVNTWHLHLFGKPRQRRTWSSIVVDINMTAYDLYRDYDSSSWGTRNNDCWSFGRLLWGHFNDKTLACVFINFYFCLCVYSIVSTACQQNTNGGEGKKCWCTGVFHDASNIYLTRVCKSSSNLFDDSLDLPLSALNRCHLQQHFKSVDSCHSFEP